MQGLLRHANVSTRLELYAQSMNSSMMKAQESMLKAILRNGLNVVNSVADDQTSELERQGFSQTTAHCNFAYSALAFLRIGISGSASFQRVRKSL